jgi:hypothetical protein
LFLTKSKKVTLTENQEEKIIETCLDHLIDVDLSKYYVKRITPVLLEHTEVQYEIVPADSQIEDQFIDSRAPEQ